MIGCAEAKLGKMPFKNYEEIGSERYQIEWMTETKHVTRVFPFFNTHTFGSLPCSLPHLTRDKLVTETHLYGPIKTNIWFPTCTEIRYLFHNVTRKHLLPNRGSSKAWKLVDPTYPDLFSPFVISEQASRQPYSSVGAQSDLMSVLLPVSLELDVSLAPPTTSTRSQPVQGKAGFYTNIQGKRRPQTL